MLTMQRNRENVFSPAQFKKTNRFSMANQFETEKRNSDNDLSVSEKQRSLARFPARSYIVENCAYAYTKK